MPQRLLLAVLLGALPLASQTPAPVSPTAMEVVVTTSLGEFRIELYPDKAPKHAALFLKNLKAGYYSGSAFHRVVPHGIIQGGDPLLKDPKTPRNLWGSGGLNLLPAEISDLKHERGTVSTINIPGKPDSDGAQFFVCISAQPSLDGKFSAFGRVTEGLDIVDKISLSPLGETGLAQSPVRILNVTLEPRKPEPFATASLAELKRTVTLKTTLGLLKLEMEPAWAPEHVRNFLKLTSSGWYNGTAFHRIAPDFVIQGGMGNTRSSGEYHAADRWVRPVKGEFRPDLKHVRGIVSMARTDDPDSATTSFFLMLGPAPHLDGKYSAFARVVDGFEVLAALEKVPVEGESPKRRLELLEASIDPLN